MRQEVKVIEDVRRMIGDVPVTDADYEEDGLSLTSVAVSRVMSSVYLRLTADQTEAVFARGTRPAYP
jgi:hypothetical protein